MITYDLCINKQKICEEFCFLVASILSPTQNNVQNKDEKNTSMYMPLIKASKSICEMKFLNQIHTYMYAEGTEREKNMFLKCIALPML